MEGEVKLSEISTAGYVSIVAGIWRVDWILCWVRGLVKVFCWCYHENLPLRPYFEHGTEGPLW